MSKSTLFEDFESTSAKQWKQKIQFDLQGKNCIVSKDTHFYDIIKLATDNKVQMVSVANELNEYMGVITIQDTITSFAQTAAVQMPGGILVISMNSIDYSMAEISRLIETENAKILSSTVKEDELDPLKIKLTIKINKTELAHIIATLERFGYKIIYCSFEHSIDIFA
mgnify:CR=1 FL=1